MPVLTLKFKDRTLRKYRIEEKQSLTIGRLEENDVVVENLAVSGYHARIDAMGDGFLLTDLKSKNGTFVNGERVVSHPLKDGEVITIGKHSLEFDYVAVEAKPEEAPSKLDQTMVLDTEQHREMMGKAAPAKAPAPPREGEKTKEEKQPEAALSMLGGGTGEVGLGKKLTKIGKDSASDIVAGGMLVGKTSATISRRPNGYYMSYVGGMSKPRINGQPLKESVRLKEFDMIEVGSLKMQFIFKS